ncbi:MAG TPA: GNAT family N-acetyltransferase [Pyrinomonadaceae bacterium]|nr:GNAT family N-acetyltransferase [Pyrinomonadaceae bacterium]
MKIEIRQATQEDAPDIARFAMKLVEQHVGYDPTRFARIATVEGMEWFYGGQTETDDAAVLVAEVDGKVVGFAYLGYEEKNYADLAVTTARLHDIYVEENARHTGAGRELIKASVGIAREFGATKLLLSVAAKNTAAKGFFEQAGFVTTMHEMMLVPDS